MALSPVVLSCHTTYTLPPAAAICGSSELPVLLLRFLVPLKPDPLFALLLKSTSLFPLLLSCHTTCTLSSAAAICGSSELPVLLLRFLVPLKPDPLFALLLKNISLFPVLLSCHTTCTLSSAAAICGNSTLPVLLLRFLVRLIVFAVKETSLFPSVTFLTFH